MEVAAIVGLILVYVLVIMPLQRLAFGAGFRMGMGSEEPSAPAACAGCQSALPAGAKFCEACGRAA